MTTQFEVYGSGRKFRWRLIAANGVAIASSPTGRPPYTSKEAAEKAIQSVKANAPQAGVVHTPKAVTDAERYQQLARARRAALKILSEPSRRAVLEWRKALRTRNSRNARDLHPDTTLTNDEGDPGPHESQP
jgi:uncharacterized protein YegP (UPF0339 family)